MLTTPTQITQVKDPNPHKKVRAPTTEANENIKDGGITPLTEVPVI